jgi:hypothetical protein
MNSETMPTSRTITLPNGERLRTATRRRYIAVAYPRPGVDGRPEILRRSDDPTVVRRTVEAHGTTPSRTAVAIDLATDEVLG